MYICLNRMYHLFEPLFPCVVLVELFPFCRNLCSSELCPQSPTSIKCVVDGPRLSRELQEKNQQVQSLQSQLRGPSGASSCCSSSSERSPSYVVSGSGRGSPTAQSPTARSPSTHSGALAPHGMSGHMCVCIDVDIVIIH